MVIMQLNLFGKKTRDLGGYNKERQKIIREHYEKVEEHNKRIKEKLTN